MRREMKKMGKREKRSLLPAEEWFLPAMLFSRQEYIRNRCVSVARRREGTEFAIGTLYIRGLPPLSPLANTMSGFVENFCGLLTPVFRVHPPRRLPLLPPLPSSLSLPNISPVHFVPRSAPYAVAASSSHVPRIARFPRSIP